ncbi:VOC family protein [Kitasatospora sp. NPDC005748]|uniref:VOC family protein n=1 Tax=Kitasatospora sp. NPDC005748 TaxID=3157063 RepID=UPI0033D9C5F0
MTPGPGGRKLRLHIDVSPTDRDQDAEPARLLALGARPVDIGQAGAEDWHVLADTRRATSSASCAPGSSPADC